MSLADIDAKKALRDSAGPFLICLYKGARG